jgi:hypothetical protein
MKGKPAVPDSSSQGVCKADREHPMNNVDNELECRVRELLAYLDTESAVEEASPFTVGFLVEKMRAAVFAKAARTLAPAQTQFPELFISK